MIKNKYNIGKKVAVYGKINYLVDKDGSKSVGITTQYDKWIVVDYEDERNYKMGDWIFLYGTITGVSWIKDEDRFYYDVYINDDKIYVREEHLGFDDFKIGDLVVFHDLGQRKIGALGSFTDGYVRIECIDGGQYVEQKSKIKHATRKGPGVYCLCMPIKLGDRVIYKDKWVGTIERIEGDYYFVKVPGKMIRKTTIANIQLVHDESALPLMVGLKVKYNGMIGTIEGIDGCKCWVNFENHGCVWVDDCLLDRVYNNEKRFKNGDEVLVKACYMYHWEIDDTHTVKLPNGRCVDIKRGDLYEF